MGILVHLDSHKIPPTKTTTTLNGDGDANEKVKVVEEEEEGASGKKAKLESVADSSRDSTPGAVDR